MNLEDQVATIEQSRKLKELGVEQTSQFYWINRPENSRVLFCKNIEFIDDLPKLSAFTVAELGIMLPKQFKYLGTSCYIQIFLNEGSGFSGCINKIDWFDNKERHPSIGNYSSYQSEAQLRATILIHLLESKFITAEDCNIRLMANQLNQQ